MVPAQFMDDLAAELEKVLEHMRLPAPRKENEVKINVFSYGLPVEKTKEDSDKKFPYILIQPPEGKIPGGAEAQQIKVKLLIGLYDKNPDNQGKRFVLDVINDICVRFSENPVLAGKYMAGEEIEWVIDDEEEYPYYYGAILMTFDIPAFGREENEYA